jgi:hypothetical protein
LYLLFARRSTLPEPDWLLAEAALPVLEPAALLVEAPPLQEVSSIHAASTRLVNPASFLCFFITTHLSSFQ